MINFKHTVFAFIVLSLLACSSNTKTPSEVPKNTHNSHQTLSQFAQSLKQEHTCKANNGIWKKVGLLQRNACILPTTDAGKTCTDNSQCQVACINKNQQIKIGKPAIGQCHDSTHQFGCRGYVKNGLAEPVLCID